MDISTADKAPGAIDFDAMPTLADVARYQAAQRPQSIALVFEGRETTFADFDTRSNQAANALIAEGLGKGDRIAYLGKNSDHYFELLFGAAKVGVVMAPIGWRLAPPEVAYIVGDAQAKLLFVGPEVADNAAQITRTECATVGAEPDHVAANPAYVLAPQLPRGAEWSAEPAYSNTLALLKQFIQARPASDDNRIYIVGFSKGADGVWHMILKNPTLFAAAMPIAGSADAYLGDYDAWAAGGPPQRSLLPPIYSPRKTGIAMKAAGSVLYIPMAGPCISPGLLPLTFP
jgi:acyl-CoA synthetase (AMP-forming)/AMP-acid ligase II